MKIKFKSGLSLTVAIFLTFGLTVSLQSLLASWVSPTGVPPINNIATPLNISSVGQYKKAGLILNAGASDEIDQNGLIVMNGNVGIGTNDPSAKLEVTGEAKFLGRIGIGDGVNEPYINAGSSGIWYSKNGAPTAFAGLTGLDTGPTDDSWGVNINGWKFIISPNGNIGIGTSSPIYSLDVNGTAHFTGDVCTDAGGGKCLSAINTVATPAVVKGASYGYCTYSTSQTCCGCGKDYMNTCCQSTISTCNTGSLLAPAVCSGNVCACQTGYTLKLPGQNSGSNPGVLYCGTTWANYYYTCVKD